MAWFVNPVTGNSGNAGTTPGAPFALLSEAASAASTDGSTDQIINVMVTGGTAITESAGIDLTGLENLHIRAYDTSGNNSEDDLLTFDWSGGIPKIFFTAAAIGLTNNTANTTTYLSGIEFDGSSIALDSFSTTQSTHILEMSDCVVRKFTISGARVRGASVIKRSYFTEMLSDGLYPLTAGLVVESCIFENIDDYAIRRNSTSVAVTLRNCLFTLCCSGHTGNETPIERVSVGATIQNSIFYNNFSNYGAYATLHDSTNSYTTDSGTYHSAGNYKNTADADDYSFDPLFVDAASSDFHLQDSSPLLELGTANSVTYTFDRELMPARPPIGPLLNVVSSLFLFSEGDVSCELIDSDFTVNSMSCKKHDYNRNIDAIPFGLTIPGSPSLHLRKKPYRVTRE